MDSKTKQYVVNMNRVLIFILILVSVLDKNDLCAILAAAYWLWLPNISKMEFDLIALKNKKKEFDRGNGK